jgi:radical SAM superfamily enzyme YgiQ (UPF0313 family)
VSGIDLLLIQPPVHLQQSEMGASQVSPNIGLAYIAACQRKLGRAVALIDAHALRLDIEQIVEQAEKLRPTVVGISAMTYQIFPAALVAEAIKRALPGTVCVLGGAHATAVPERTMLEFSSFDAVMIGEGDWRIGEVLDQCGAAEGEVFLKALPGLYVRDGDIEISRQAPEQVEDLDALPRPAFDLFPLKEYWPFYSRKWRMELPMSASRGCPFKCTFCTKVMGDRVRFRSAESLVDELECFRAEHGLEQVIFTDENFTLKRNLVEGFCKGVIQRGLNRNLRLICQSRVTVEPELMPLMAKAGFTHITFGIESGDQEILEKACKSIQLDQSRAAVKAAKAAGMIVDGNFILGLPFETEATVRRTIDFACSLPLDYASFFLLVPYPGSGVMEMAKKGEGNLRLLSEDWAEYGKQTGGAVELTTVTRRRLERIQLLGYLRFYAHPKRWLPVLRKVSVRTIATFLVKRLLAGAST